MRYGLDFNLRVLQAIMLLNLQESREYTVREVLNFYITHNNPDFSDAYMKTAYQRVWISLNRLSREGFCSKAIRKHPDKNLMVGYYKFVKSL